MCVCVCVCVYDTTKKKKTEKTILPDREATGARFHAAEWEMGAESPPKRGRLN